MRKSLVLSAAAAMGALLVLGCGSWSQDNDAAAWTRHDAAEWRITDTSPPHQRQSLATTLPSQAETELPPDASAEDYVRIAVENNPSIRSAEAKVRRLAAGVPQATSLDDPMLEVTPIGSMPETAAGAMGLMTGLRQELPFPGKLETRGRIASQDAASAQKDLQQVRLSVIAETRQAFWSYYVAARAIEVTRESQNLLSQFRQAAEAKYRANTATQQVCLRENGEGAGFCDIRQRQPNTRHTCAGLLDNHFARTLNGFDNL